MKNSMVYQPQGRIKAMIMAWVASGSSKSSKTLRSWLCTSVTCAVLLFGLFHVWASSRLSPPSAPKDTLPSCLQCNPDVQKWLVLAPTEIKSVAIVSNKGPGRPLSRQSVGTGYSTGGYLSEGEKYMWYAPHSGFSNQVMELRNALLFARLLNRTLIIPPVLEHHAAWLGSCPKNRVLKPHRLRALVWTHFSDLIMNSRYISMADIITLSGISPSKVKTIDLRVFVALWCGVDVSASCGGPICNEFAERASVWGSLETCGKLLNPVPQLQQRCCVYGVGDDCTSTVWTHSGNWELGKLNDSVRLQRRSMLGSSCDYGLGDGGPMGPVASRQATHQRHLLMRHYTQGRLMDVGGLHRWRHRRPLTENFKDTSSEWKTEKVMKMARRRQDIVTALGPGSAAGSAPVLAFGSMFSMSYRGAQTYIDIKSPSGDKDSDDLLHLLKFLPFNQDITAAGKQYVREVIGKPFFCAQLRLLDGQFKNHWVATFGTLRVELERYHQAQKGSREILPVFVMTDLPSRNWTGTFLQQMVDAKTLYRVLTLHGSNNILQETARKIRSWEYGFRSGYVPGGLEGSRVPSMEPLTEISDILLYVEEMVCSCASLGFVGTRGSTVADNIKDLRMAMVCSDVVRMFG